MKQEDESDKLLLLVISIEVVLWIRTIELKETFMAYILLSDDIKEQIRKQQEGIVLSEFACCDTDVIRRNPARDKASVLRPAFVRDVEKIINIPYYLRYGDKTQVFSLQKNDDISRRSYHVQLVSRIARNIGRALNLNVDLIEAISLGHDLGHTPFGHAGERKLNEIYHARTGRYFNHNIQSARILDTIFSVNVSLQTLDGIICHNGEMEMKEYRPEKCESFEEYDSKIENSLTKEDGIKRLIPGTLEGCVMRVADIIAYLGKDRQDAIKLGIIEDDCFFSDSGIGRFNAEIINNMTVNIIENSFGKPYLKMDEVYFEALSKAKKENYELIYKSKEANRSFKEQIYPMIEEVYEKLFSDLVSGKKSSIIYTHHLDYIKQYSVHYDGEFSYMQQDPNDIVVDAISSMTDDYLIDLYQYLFPKGKYGVTYKGYFE